MQNTRSRSLQAGALAAILLAVLSVTAPAAGATDAQKLVQAADGLVVGSQHDTQSEFSNAQTLTNLTATSSGDGAITFDKQSATTVEGFEDSSPLSEWSGDLTPYDANQSRVHSGSWAVRYEPTGNFDYINRSLGQTKQYQNISYWVNTDSHSDIRPIVQLRNDTTIFTRIGVDDGTHTSDPGSIIYYDGSSWLDTGIDIQTDAWYRIRVTNIDYSADEFDIVVTDANGNTVGSASNLASETGVDNLNDINIGGKDSRFWIDDITTVKGQSPNTALYLSQVHAVSSAEQAAINITQATNVSVEATVRTTGGTILNQSTFTTTGNHTLTLASTSADKLEVKLNISTTGSNPSFEVSDESILFSNHLPTASNLEPANGTQLTESTVNFSVDVADAEFPTAQGDEVTAELFVDGESVGSQSVTSNQTVTVEHTLSEGGQHDYYWKLSDSYGASTTTDTQSVEVPSELQIYNSSAPTTLVDSVTVELRMYTNETGTPEVYERSTSSGTINMTGLPADKPFIVVAEAENYTSRRIFIPSLYETQRIFLLPTSEEAVPTEFQLEDYTGNYPGADSVLLVQRALNGSYQTVLGDYFGANDQFPAQLEYNVRHRLVIMNTETGQQRVVGTYTPQSASTQTIAVTPTGITSFVKQPASIAVQPTAGRLPAVNNANVSVTFDNNSATITSWNITAVASGANNSTTLWTYETSASGTVSQQLDLRNRANQTLFVNVTYVTGDGATFTKTRKIALDEVYQNDATLIATLTQLADLSAPGTRGEFTTFMSMLVTVFAVAATARIQPSSVVSGFTGIMVVTGFAVLGWVSYDVVFVAAVGFVGFTAIERGL